VSEGEKNSLFKIYKKKNLSSSSPKVISRNVRSRQQIGLHRLSLLTLRIHILVMVICLASFFSSSSPKVIYSKSTEQAAKRTTTSESPDSKDSYPCNVHQVQRSFTRNVRSRQQIGLHRLSLLTLRIHILVMFIKSKGHLLETYGAGSKSDNTV
ncbi:hypothetical protein Avbf_05655, partial [Armadillidium vulgare]